MIDAARRLGLSETLALVPALDLGPNTTTLVMISYDETLGEG
jgi:hypothetical protein